MDPFLLITTTEAYLPISLQEKPIRHSEFRLLLKFHLLWDDSLKDLTPSPSKEWCKVCGGITARGSEEMWRGMNVWGDFRIGQKNSFQVQRKEQCLYFNKS